MAISKVIDNLVGKLKNDSVLQTLSKTSLSTSVKTISNVKSIARVEEEKNVLKSPFDNISDSIYTYMYNKYKSDSKFDAKMTLASTFYKVGAMGAFKKVPTKEEVEKVYKKAKEDNFLDKVGNVVGDVLMTAVNVATAPVNAIIRDGKPAIGDEDYNDPKFGKVAETISKVSGIASLAVGAVVAAPVVAPVLASAGSAVGGAVGSVVSSIGGAIGTGVSAVGTGIASAVKTVGKVINETKNEEKDMGFLSDVMNVVNTVGNVSKTVTSVTDVIKGSAQQSVVETQPENKTLLSSVELGSNNLMLLGLGLFLMLVLFKR